MPRPAAYKIGSKKVVGTTTPINNWGGGGKTNNLCDWAQRLATEYEYHDGKLVHVPKYWATTRDDRGTVGTVTHAIWSKLIDPKQPDPDFSECKPWQKAEAEALGEELEKWTQRNPLDIIAVEEAMVSREHNYGGTPDVIDSSMVVDLKTGFVNEFTCVLQLSAYNHLAKENRLTNSNLGGMIVQPFDGRVRVYRYSAKTLSLYFPTFLALLQTYNDEKEFNKHRKKTWAKTTK